MSFWSLSWETFQNRRRRPGANNPATAACIAATSWANRVALAGGGPGGPASPTGPTGPGSPSGGGGGGGGGSGGAGPPPGPPAPLPGGTGAAISSTQCNNKLSPTLLIDNRSIESSPYCLCKHLGHLYAFVGLWIASNPGCLL